MENKQNVWVLPWAYAQIFNNISNGIYFKANLEFIIAYCVMKIINNRADGGVY